MTTLSITKVNETYIKVLAEPYIQAELSEFFTFQVPGYRFMPAYRSKRWDGKLRLYSKATGKIYGGLLSYIYAFAKEREYKIEIENDVYVSSKINKTDSDNFCNSLKPKSNIMDLFPDLNVPMPSTDTCCNCEKEKRINDVRFASPPLSKIQYGTQFEEISVR